MLILNSRNTKYEEAVYLSKRSICAGVRCLREFHSLSGWYCGCYILVHGDGVLTIGIRSIAFAIFVAILRNLTPCIIQGFEYIIYDRDFVALCLFSLLDCVLFSCSKVAIWPKEILFNEFTLKYINENLLFVSNQIFNVQGFRRSL